MFLMTLYHLHPTSAFVSDPYVEKIFEIFFCSTRHFIAVLIYIKAQWKSYKHKQKNKNAHKWVSTEGL